MDRNDFVVSCDDMEVLSAAARITLALFADDKEEVREFVKYFLAFGGPDHLGTVLDRIWEYGASMVRGSN